MIEFDEDNVITENYQDYLVNTRVAFLDNYLLSKFGVSRSLSDIFNGVNCRFIAYAAVPKHLSFDSKGRKLIISHGDNLEEIMDMIKYYYPQILELKYRVFIATRDAMVELEQKSHIDDFKPLNLNEDETYVLRKKLFELKLSY